MTTCLNCQYVFDGNYCPNCGTQNNVPKITFRYLVAEVLKVFMLEKGIFVTIRDFLFAPGKSTYVYLYQNRKKYVSPIIFLLVTSLIYSIVNKYFHVEESIMVDMQIDGNDERAVRFTNDSMKWIQDNYGYANLIMSVFVAFFTWLFFKKGKLNFFEILSVLCYFEGVSMLFFTISALIKVFGKVDLFSLVSLFMLIYISAAIASMYRPVRILSYFKAFIAYILGFVFFYISFILVYFSIHAS